MLITTLQELKDYLLENFEEELQQNDFQTIFDNFKGRQNPLMRELFEDKLGIDVLHYLTDIPPYYFAYSKMQQYKIPSHIKKVGEGAFNNCRFLKEIVIPKGVKRLGSCFGNCNALETISIPSSVEYIDRNTFASCNNLKSITLPKRFTNLNFIGISPQVKVTYI